MRRPTSSHRTQWNSRILFWWSQSLQPIWSSIISARLSVVLRESLGPAFFLPTVLKCCWKGWTELVDSICCHATAKQSIIDFHIYFTVNAIAKCVVNNLSCLHYCKCSIKCMVNNLSYLRYCKCNSKCVVNIDHICSTVNVMVNVW